jgi:hypothetical protein
MASAKKPIVKSDDAESKGNIENLSALSREFASGKMIPKKALMLKLRLVELWNGKIITDSELVLLENMLTREMKRGQIEDKHLEVLNRIEQAQCTEKARCKVDDAPRVFFVNKDQVCSFKRHEQSNIKKIEAGSEFVYTIFVEKTIPPEFQMTKELLMKEERGHHASEESYPKERIILHRLNLDDGWFDKIFEIEEDLLSETIEDKDAFTF